ncbi:MAG: hypothetical protein ACQEVT_13280 [Pseudomonadota bacterium]|uniref:hypothetical protein n=1 Tax=Roseovarius TaxID=74030 RepID=UPI0022A88C4C|nr:hypothetical protein [Roseovarius sp. EGI FJ00037]MCZ0814158.1 hypothetical protein [Roseovarius sp. EGI FJ00037]
MSWRIANECALRKQIIVFLADKASDDGSGIWCREGRSSGTPGWETPRSSDRSGRSRRWAF